MKAWENGLLDRLDNAFEPTPDRFHRRFESMLASLQAQPAPKPRRLRMRTAVVVALIALLLGATAFALPPLRQSASGAAPVPFLRFHAPGTRGAGHRTA